MDPKITLDIGRLGARKVQIGPPPLLYDSRAAERLEVLSEKATKRMIALWVFVSKSRANVVPVMIFWLVGSRLAFLDRRFKPGGRWGRPVDFFTIAVMMQRTTLNWP